MVLLVTDQHRVEFITGYGLEAILPDALCYQIQQEDMVPFFKENDYNTGMLSGIEIVVNILSETDVPEYVTAFYTYEERSSYLSKITYFLIGIYILLFAYKWILRFFIKEDKEKILIYIEPFNTIRYHFFIGYIILYAGYINSQNWVYWVYLGINILLVFRWLNIYSKLKKERDPYKKRKIALDHSNNILDYIFSFPFYFLNKLLVHKAYYWRHVPRFSPEGKLMHLLTEEEDDEFLSKGQIKEEIINSVEYDVWVTDDRKEFLVLEYNTQNYTYSKCNKCGYKTWYEVYDKITVSPDYTRSGKREIKYVCKNCGHFKKEKYTIPKLVYTTSDSNSTSSNYSSSNSNYTSSSSYDSGGSWGGGSSGGGGAGSSW